MRKSLFGCGALVICAVILGTPSAYSHKTASGWQYPLECCGRGDCDQAKVGERDGKMTLTTKLHGERIIPAGIVPRQSGDSEWHLCAAKHTPFTYCVFAPTMY